MNKPKEMQTTKIHPDPMEERVLAEKALMVGFVEV